MFPLAEILLNILWHSFIPKAKISPRYQPDQCKFPDGSDSGKVVLNLKLLTVILLTSIVIIGVVISMRCWESVPTQRMRRNIWVQGYTWVKGLGR